MSAPELDDPIKAASCIGKEPLNKRTARLLIRKTDKVKLNVYKCQYCKHWHVGAVTISR